MSNSEATIQPSLDLYTPEANNFTISDLITHLQSTFITYDFDLVTRILSAREDQAKKDHSLLEEKHTALEDELKSYKKENEELRAEILRSKDEHESLIVELRGKIECMERDERKAEALFKLYRSRFEKMIRRVARLEEDAKLLFMPHQPRAEEEAREHNGEKRGQLTQEICCLSHEKKKGDPCDSKSKPVTAFKIEQETEAVSKTHTVSETIDVNNETVLPSNGRNSTSAVIEIIDSDNEPMGVKALASAPKRKGVSPYGGVDDNGSGSVSQLIGGEIKLSQNSNVNLKFFNGSHCPTAPTTSPSNNIETSGTSSTKRSSGVLISCEGNTRSEQTSEYLLTQINKLACEDRSSDNSDDNCAWKNEEDMIMALEKNPELCMRAICALYGEKSFNGLELHSTECNDKSTAPRGTDLAEYLNNGDPQAKLKTLVAELQKKDEQGLRDCKSIAKVYSKKLFEMSKKDNDISHHFFNTKNYK